MGLVSIFAVLHAIIALALITLAIVLMTWTGRVPQIYTQGMPNSYDSYFLRIDSVIVGKYTILFSNPYRLIITVCSDSNLISYSDACCSVWFHVILSSRLYRERKLLQTNDSQLVKEEHCINDSIHHERALFLSGSHLFYWSLYSDASIGYGQ